MGVATNNFQTFMTVIKLSMAPILVVGFWVYKRKGDTMTTPWMLVIGGGLFQAFALIACAVLYIVYRNWYPLIGAGLTVVVAATSITVALRLYNKQRAI
ncbi:MAG: hypothetical protein JNK33_05190 [Candidatus Doudnabacteria bacterium]|nr:hypothetical protein [Candidatus Doudnabacteria bacterium]